MGGNCPFDNSKACSVNCALYNNSAKKCSFVLIAEYLLKISKSK